MYTGYADLPMSTSLWNYYGSESEKMVKEYPVEEDKLYGGNFLVWAHESYMDSKGNVYPGFEVGVKPNDEYRAMAAKICRERIMYGGARLADLLVQIFEDQDNYTAFLQ